MYNNYFKKNYILKNNFPSTLFEDIKHKRDYNKYIKFSKSIPCSCKKEENKRKHQELCVCIAFELVFIYQKMYKFIFFMNNIENINKSKFIRHCHNLNDDLYFGITLH